MHITPYQWTDWFVLGVVVITITGVAIGRFPVFRMNRATIALLGAAVLIVPGFIRLDEACQSIDFNTIVLLFSMMIINVNLRLAGFFSYMANRIIMFARTPIQMLALIAIASGFLSGLFLNDTIVIMFTPIVLELTLVLKRNPLPYLLALATSANAGSVATMVGNPQNMIIGIASGLSFTTFTRHLLPPAILGLLVVIVVIRFLFHREFGEEIIFSDSGSEVRIFRPLLIKSIISLIIMITAFLSGVSVTLAAFGAAVLLLFTRRIKPERVFAELDWGLLVFFSGLFVVTGVLNHYISNFTDLLTPVTGAENSAGKFSLFAVLLSNLISNVPAVMVLGPFVRTMSDPRKYWLLLALTTTFAGNLTLLGSVANLIVAEIARKRGVVISFKGYLKAGLPITLISTVFGVVWVYYSI